MTHINLPIAVLIALSCWTTALSDVIPGRWEKVESLAEGAPIWVTTKSRGKIQGALLELHDTSLMVATHTGDRIELARIDIVEISGPKRERRGFWSGTKIGALAGFGAGLAIGLAAGDDGVFDDFTGEFNGVVLGGILAGPGALAGHILDKAGSKTRLYYRAPKP